MMHGHEKSDLAIVAEKPANKVASPVVEQSTMGPAAAESVERRVGTKGNADRQSTHWTQRQARVSQALDCMRLIDLVASRLALRAPALRAATALTRPSRSAQRLPFSSRCSAARRSPGRSRRRLVHCSVASTRGQGEVRRPGAGSGRNVRRGFWRLPSQTI